MAILDDPMGALAVLDAATGTKRTASAQGAAETVFEFGHLKGSPLPSSCGEICSDIDDHTHWIQESLYTLSTMTPGDPAFAELDSDLFEQWELLREAGEQCHKQECDCYGCNNGDGTGLFW